MNGDTDDITIISQGVTLDGKISSEGSIRVDGTIQGDVNSQENVTVGESGEVFGQINGQIITIGGKVNGVINAKDRLILEAKAKLKGDVFTKIFVIEAGAQFDGKSNMGESKNTTSSSTPTIAKNETGS